MKIFLTMFIAFLITTISYAQVNNVINTTRNKILVWNEKSKQWDSEGIVHRPVKFTFKMLFTLANKLNLFLIILKLVIAFTN